MSLGNRMSRGTEALEGLGRTIHALVGRPWTDEEQRSFGQYLDLLMVWNRAQRLTGHQSAEQITTELFRDSILFLAKLPQGPIRILDIGAGAGIPGIPLKIVRPEMSLWMIESKRKRVSFLATVKRQLGLSAIEIVEGRAEDLVKVSSRLQKSFDAVVARSVGPPAMLLPIALSYLKPGGVFVAGARGPKSASPGAGDVSLLKTETIHYPSVRLSRTFVTATKPLD